MNIIAYICKRIIDIDFLNMLKRTINYDGSSCIRTTAENMGTAHEDVSQNGYEEYHSHPDYQLMLVTEGECEIMVAGVTLLARTGEVVLLGPDVPHVLHSATSICRGILIQFNHSIFPSSIRLIPDYSMMSKLLDKSNGGLYFQGNKSDFFNSLFENVHVSEGIMRICNLYILLNKLGERPIEGETVSSFFDRPEVTRHRDIVSECKRFIHKHYREPLLLEQIADAIGVTPVSLCRNFRKKTAETVFNYLIRLRIEAVARQLRNTDLTIAEIAYQNGFDSLPHFYRKFRHITGYTPTEYRNRFISKNNQ